MTERDQLLAELSKRERVVALAVTNPPRTTDEAAAYLDRDRITITGHLGRVYKKMQGIVGHVPIKERRQTLRAILGGEA